jgi:hypothetical protein
MAGERQVTSFRRMLPHSSSPLFLNKRVPSLLQFLLKVLHEVGPVEERTPPRDVSEIVFFANKEVKEN